MKKIVIGLVFLALVAGVVFCFMSTKDKDTQTTASSTVATTTTETTQTSEETTDSTEEQSLVDQTLDQMSLAEKVGQLFFARVPETNQLEDLQTYHLGGYLLFGRDVENETQDSLKAKIASYQEASAIPLLIGADEEGGTVTRISRNEQLVETPFAAPQDIYASAGLAGVEQDTQHKAQILHDYGIATGLFPVADVSTDPEAFIYDRTIGLDSDGTSEYVKKVVETLKAAHSGSTLKHFPGYGNNRDSHVEIVTDDRSLTELQETALPAFQAGIDAGADSVLVSHNIVTSLDPNVPASISPAVHQLLREDMHFDGVVMTDDMDMAGLADFISQEEAGLAALQAGNDLVMSSSYSIQIPYVMQAVQAGTYSEAQLDASVRRVLTWKFNLGLLE